AQTWAFVDGMDAQRFLKRGHRRFRIAILERVAALDGLPERGSVVPVAEIRSFRRQLSRAFEQIDRFVESLLIEPDITEPGQSAHILWGAAKNLFEPSLGGCRVFILQRLEGPALAGVLDRLLLSLLQTGQRLLKRRVGIAPQVRFEVRLNRGVVLFPQK